MRIFAVGTIVTLGLVTLGLVSTTFAFPAVDNKQQLSDAAIEATPTSAPQSTDSVSDPLITDIQAAEGPVAEESSTISQRDASSVIVGVESTATDTALPAQETGIADVEGEIVENIGVLNITAAECAAQLAEQFGQNRRGRGRNAVSPAAPGGDTDGRGRNNNGRGRNSAVGAASELLSALRNARQRGRGQLEQAGQRSQGRGQGRPQGQLGGDGANPDGNNGTGRGRGQGGQNAQDRAAERNDDKARNGRGANGNADLVTTIEAILEQLGQEAIDELCGAAPEDQIEEDPTDIDDDDAELELENDDTEVDGDSAVDDEIEENPSGEAEVNEEESSIEDSAEAAADGEVLDTTDSDESATTARRKKRAARCLVRRSNVRF